ncbi:hypothetical protein LF95_17025 [Thalassospira sp. TSL5-1]|nr:hypothetical protein LF95_17025 [Thalassospira sp. TSL5-1]
MKKNYRNQVQYFIFLRKMPVWQWVNCMFVSRRYSHFAMRAFGTGQGFAANQRVGAFVCISLIKLCIFRWAALRGVCSRLVVFW